MLLERWFLILYNWDTGGIVMLSEMGDSFDENGKPVPLRSTIGMLERWKIGEMGVA